MTILYVLIRQPDNASLSTIIVKPSFLHTVFCFILDAITGEKVDTVALDMLIVDDNMERIV